MMLKDNIKVHMYTMLNVVCRQYRKHHFYFSHNVELMEKIHHETLKNNYYGYFWMCLMLISGPMMILPYDEITIKYNKENNKAFFVHPRETKFSSDSM